MKNVTLTTSTTYPLRIQVFESNQLKPSTLRLLLTILLIAITTLMSYAIAQPATNILNGVQRWEGGGHWNPDGTINDAPNAPEALGIIRCGSSAETQSQVAPKNNFVYNSNVFLIDVAQSPVPPVDPSDGSAVTVLNPTEAQPLIWLNLDVRPYAGSFQIQINDNSGDNIGWALYTSSAHEAGVQYIPASGDSLSGTAGTLTMIAAGVESSSTWNTLPIASENFTKATNLYLAIWDQDADGDVSINNFKARYGCGDAGDYVICALTNDAPVVSCVDGDFYEVAVTIYGSNGLYEATDNTGSAVDISDPVCLGNVGDGGSISETVTLVYPIGVDYNFDIKAVANPDNCADPENVSDCQIIGISGASVTKPVLTATAIQIACNGGFGIGDAAATGGAEPYSFMWSTGEETQQIGNLIPGEYTVTVTDANGCTDEALITIDEEPSLITNEIAATICEGDTYSFDGQDLDAAGEYEGTFQSAAGCDSVVTLTLSVTEIIYNEISATICEGDTYSFDGQELDAAGEYEGTFQSAAGCDSVVTLILSVTEIIYNEISATICEGDSYSFDGQDLDAAGKYEGTFQSAAGCDSVVTLTLSVTEIIYNEIAATICEGDTYSFDGQDLDAAGEYEGTFQSAAGCDSVVTLTLSVTEIIYNEIAATICEGNTYSFDGQDLDAAGEYEGTFQSAAGCDSVVTLILSVTEIIYNEISATICEGDSYSFDGQDLDAAGKYEGTFQSAAGCDSVVTLTLSVTEIIYNEIAATICEGDSYSFDGQELDAAGEYEGTFQSAAGCDSVVTLTLSVTEIIYNEIAATICEGDSYSFDGQDLDAAGEYEGTFQSAAGCDSVVTLTLSVTEIIYNEIAATICEGDSYSFNGQELDAAGEYEGTFQSAAGCDSVVTLTLSVTEIIIDVETVKVNCDTQTGSISLTVNGGTAPYSYDWTSANGSGIVQGEKDQNALTAGTYVVAVYDANDCMSQAEVTLTAPDCSTPICLKLTPCQIICNDGTGSITSTVVGGTAPYTYLWSNGETTESISGLAPGKYTATVTDANGLKDTRSTTIEAAPDAISIVAKTIAVSCETLRGSILLDVSGGTPEYRFVWKTTNGSGIVEGEKDQSNLTAGTYVVAVYDANDCMSQAEVTLTAPDCSTPICLKLTPCQILCNDGTGSIKSTVAGGTAPYTYLWSNGETTESISGLAPGKYTATVTDANGLKDTRSTTIEAAPDAISIVAETIAVSCETLRGGIMLDVSGGTPEYRFVWKTTNGSGIVQGDKDQSDLTAGTYVVCVFDANSCELHKEITLIEPDCNAPICLKLTPCQILCNDGTGSIKTIVEGGYPPYTYLWSNGETTPTISGLQPGVYTCTATDISGNKDTRKTTINPAPQPLALHAEVTPSMETENNGSIVLYVEGGTEPYSYKWCTGATTKDISELTPGNYFVDVTDKNGCTTRNNWLVERSTSTAINETLAWQKAKAFAYPNPFISNVVIEVSSENNTKGMVQLYDAKGALLAIPFNSKMIGREIYSVRYDGANLPAGSIIIYKFITNDKVVTGKLIKR